jgi:histidine triad (HIT) family protein
VSLHDAIRGELHMLTKQESDSNMPSAECIFCKQRSDHYLLEKRIIYEDELFLASHPLDEKGPSYLGLVLIQTKRHASDLGELCEAEAQGLGSLIQRISKALKEATGAAWTYCYCFMEGVRHVHVFLTARYPDITAEYVRLNIGNWPKAPVGGKEHVEDLAQKIRQLVCATKIVDK